MLSTDNSLDNQMLDDCGYRYVSEPSQATARSVQELLEKISTGEMSWQFLSEAAYRLGEFTVDELSSHAELPRETTEDLMRQNNGAFERSPLTAELVQDGKEVWNFTLKAQEGIKMAITERSKLTPNEAFLSSARMAGRLVDALIEDIAKGEIDKKKQQEAADLAQICITTARNRLNRAIEVNGRRTVALAPYLSELKELESRLETQRLFNTL